MPTQPARRPKTSLGRRFRHAWNLHFRGLDLIASLILGCLLDYILILRDPAWATTLATQRGGALFTTGAAITGVLLGLTLTSLAIIADHIRQFIRVPDSAAARGDSGQVVMPEDGARQLVGAFVGTTYYLGVATITALVGFVPTGTIALKAVLAAWVVATVVAIIAVARCTSLLGSMVRGIITRG